MAEQDLEDTTDYLAHMRQTEAALAALHRQTLDAHLKKIIATDVYRRMMQL